jgi:hypothetical protein
MKTDGIYQREVNMRNCMRPTRLKTAPVSKLVAIRSDLQKLLVRLDEAINEDVPLLREAPPRETTLRPRNAFDEGRRRSPQMQQTYLPEYDFREDRLGLSAKVTELLDRVRWLDDNSESFTDGGLHLELQLRTAEARLLQIQCNDAEPEWNDIITIIRTLTRIVTDERPGFVYGLATNHTTDWGQKITDVKAQIASDARPSTPSHS